MNGIIGRRTRDHMITIIVYIDKFMYKYLRTSIAHHLSVFL